jgi:hypothetical protein
VSAAERHEIPLTNGRILHMLTDGDGGLYGFIYIEADGKARIYCKTWVDEYAPTNTVYPGFISAARAVLQGVA